jgi:hypothetical protein
MRTIIGLIQLLGLFVWEIIRNRFQNPGVKTDEFPNAIGRFGFDVTNPIPCKGFFGPTQYLEKIEFSESMLLRFERIGSTASDNIAAEHIDYYSIFIKGQKHITLYLAPHQKKTSRKLPKGFNWK